MDTRLLLRQLLVVSNALATLSALDSVSIFLLTRILLTRFADTPFPAILAVAITEPTTQWGADLSYFTATSPPSFTPPSFIDRSNSTVRPPTPTTLNSTFPQSLSLLAGAWIFAHANARAQTAARAAIDFSDD